MTDRLEYYTTIKRAMFSRINDVGAKPFLLFQYYLTYSTAKKINPTLKTVALDMGILDKKGNPQISAVSHLKKELIHAGWIEEKGDEIFIIFDPEKTAKVEKISTAKLRKSQQGVEKISTQVEKISTNSLDFLNFPYKEENKQEITVTTERAETAPVAAAKPEAQTPTAAHASLPASSDGGASSSPADFFAAAFDIALNNFARQQIDFGVGGEIFEWREFINERLMTDENKPQHYRNAMPKWIMKAFAEWKANQKTPEYISVYEQIKANAPKQAVYDAERQKRNDELKKQTAAMLRAGQPIQTQSH